MMTQSSPVSCNIVFHHHLPRHCLSYHRPCAYLWLCPLVLCDHKLKPLFPFPSLGISKCALAYLDLFEWLVAAVPTQKSCFGWSSRVRQVVTPLGDCQWWWSPTLPLPLWTINIMTYVTMIPTTVVDYLLWDTQFNSFIIIHQLHGMPDSSIPQLTSTILVARGIHQPNVTYSHWLGAEQLIR